MSEANKWEEEIDFLKSILTKTPLVETTKWGIPVYTYDKKNVLGLAGFKNYFGIWFYNGVFLKDKDQRLVNAQENVTKAMRQMRFTSKDEIDEKIVLEYVQEAIENEKKGLVHKPEKKETVLPEVLRNCLEEKTELKKAFEQLTPYKQREYAEHISSAKRAATQESRLQKIIPMILEGKGLNDKYR